MRTRTGLTKTTGPTWSRPTAGRYKSVPKRTRTISASSRTVRKKIRPTAGRYKNVPKRTRTIWGSPRTVQKKIRPTSGR
ncbi:MAG TPA: hypothetical protein VLJ16_02600 [Acidobacteriota bacterium]|nr:hypothetical protein [Acidobacteriota bacterium]